MKDKFKEAIDKILKNGTTTQWIFTGKEDEDNKTLAKDIYTLHQQAMKEAEKKLLNELLETFVKGCVDSEAKGVIVAHLQDKLKK